MKSYLYLWAGIMGLMVLLFSIGCGDVNVSSPTSPSAVIQPVVVAPPAPNGPWSYFTMDPVFHPATDDNIVWSTGEDNIVWSTRCAAGGGQYLGVVVGERGRVFERVCRVRGSVSFFPNATFLVTQNR